MKLIRHKIPALAAARGHTLAIRKVATVIEFKQLLREKLIEEAGEFAAAPSLEELADVQEVLRTLLTAYGWSQDDLERAWQKKRAEAGVLSEGVVLLDTKTCATPGCGDVFVPTRLLQQRCARHFVEVNDIILVSHKGAIERAQVTAAHGQTFSYRLDVGISDPDFVGQCSYESEGVRWTRDLDAAGALRAAEALAR